jgi:hypothetical protein
MRYLCLLFLVFLASCKSLDSVQCTIDSVHHNSVSQLSSLNSQLSTVHDSIVYRERIVHDTVFITKEVYRDKQLSTLNSQLSTIADTIHVVEFRDRVVEPPPKRYIPPFYKRCTIVLWIIIALGIVYLILRTKIHAFHF